MYTVVDYLWFFFCYAFLGWVIEVCFQAIAKGKFENRGFLNGPVCPIYGFGVSAVVLCLTPLKDSWLMLFLGSLILTSTLEFITGFLFEKLFHQRWWDYSRMWANIKGYVCPLFSLIWGGACTILIKFIHVPIAAIVNLIPKWVSAVVLPLFIITFVIDVAATVKTMLKLEEKLKTLDKLANQIHESSQKLALGLYDKTKDAHKTFVEVKEELEDRKEAYEAKVKEMEEKQKALVEKYQALLDKMAYGEKRMFRAFPDMRSLSHNEQQEKIKQRLKQMIEERKKRA